MPAKGRKKTKDVVEVKRGAGTDAVHLDRDGKYYYTVGNDVKAAWLQTKPKAFGADMEPFAKKVGAKLMVNWAKRNMGKDYGETLRKLGAALYYTFFEVKKSDAQQEVNYMSILKHVWDSCPLETRYIMCVFELSHDYTRMGEDSAYTLTVKMHGFINRRSLSPNDVTYLQRPDFDDEGGSLSVSTKINGLSWRYFNSDGVVMVSVGLATLNPTAVISWLDVRQYRNPVAVVPQQPVVIAPAPREEQVVPVAMELDDNTLDMSTTVVEEDYSDLPVIYLFQLKPFQITAIDSFFSSACGKEFSFMQVVRERIDMYRTVYLANLKLAKKAWSKSNRERLPVEAIVGKVKCNVIDSIHKIWSCPITNGHTTKDVVVKELISTHFSRFKTVEHERFVVHFILSTYCRIPDMFVWSFLAECALLNYRLKQMGQDKATRLARSQGLELVNGDVLDTVGQNMATFMLDGKAYYDGGRTVNLCGESGSLIDLMEDCLSICHATM